MRYWAEDAPRSLSFQVRAGTMKNDDLIFPCVSLAFGLTGPDAEPLTVTLVGSPSHLRRFAKDVAREVEKAERQSMNERRNRGAGPRDSLNLILPTGRGDDETNTTKTADTVEGDDEATPNVTAESRVDEA